MDESPTWYLAEGGRTLGPFTKAQVLEQLQGGKATRNTMAFRHGTTAQWMPLGQVAEFAASPAEAEKAPEAPKPAAPPAPIRERAAAGVPGGPTAVPAMVSAPGIEARTPAAKGPAPGAERIEHQICGGEVQHLEVDLQPGSSIHGDSGAIICCDGDVSIDGAGGAGGSPLALFTHRGAAGRRRLALGGPVTGAVVAVELKREAGALWCRLDGLLCHERGISAPGGLKTVPGPTPGEGLVLHQIEGDGICFLQAAGRAIRRRMDSGEQVRVDPACLLACEARVAIDVEPAGGEGPRLAVLKGPGVVWLQSQSASRLVSRMRAMSRPQG